LNHAIAQIIEAPLHRSEQQLESCSQCAPLGIQDGLGAAWTCDAVSAATKGAT
jgi:hypothetical protein